MRMSGLLKREAIDEWYENCDYWDKMSSTAKSNAKECNSDDPPVCVGSPDIYPGWFPIYFSKLQDTFAVPVNMRDDVSEGKPPQVITECTSS